MTSHLKYKNLQVYILFDGNINVISVINMRLLSGADMNYCA